MEKFDSSGWVSAEFSSVDFGDERVAKRFFKTVERMAVDPEDPISKSCGTKSEVKGAYRLFANERVSSDEILAAHQKSLCERLRGHKIVLAVQDTTYLNYDNHKKLEGVGTIGQSRHSDPHLGLVAHSSLAVAVNGTPLGIFNQLIWARAIKERGEKRYRTTRHNVMRSLPIEDKESCKWLDSVRKTRELLSKDCQTAVVTIADREADISSFIAGCELLSEKFLIRAKCQRQVKRARGQIEIETALIKLPVKFRFQIPIPTTTWAKSRLATLSVRYDTVSLTDCKIRSSELGRHTLHPKVSAILIEEIHPPKEATRIKWLLLTNMFVVNDNDARERIDWYTIRWTIEEWHKIWKSGCKIEKLKFSKVERLEKCLTVYAIIAHKIQYLIKVSRQSPEIPCTSILAEEEWQILQTYFLPAKKARKTPPSISQATLWIAQLGGYQNRKSDPPPGVHVLWRGLQDLSAMLKLWQRLNSRAE